MVIENSPAPLPLRDESGKRELTIEAPAKINLFLAVLGKRSDGYHNIVTAMQKIALCDRLHLCCDGEGIQLRCPMSNLPENSTNLAWKAAKLFFDRAGIASNVKITLEKKIPVAAGLGGGSSDAAAVLVGLNKLCGTVLATETLLSLAEALGSDVPFFVAESPTSLATGTGTDLEPFEGPAEYWLVLVNPGIAVSSGWAYQNLLLTTTDNFYKFRGSLASIDNTVALLTDALRGASASQRLFNDLESVTINKYPAIQHIKDKLRGSGAICTLMSGSGSTVFGVFNEYDLAKKSFDAFRQQYQEVFFTKPLS